MLTYTILGLLVGSLLTALLYEPLLDKHIKHMRSIVDQQVAECEAHIFCEDPSLHTDSQLPAHRGNARFLQGVTPMTDDEVETWCKDRGIPLHGDMRFTPEEDAELDRIFSQMPGHRETEPN